MADTEAIHPPARSTGGLCTGTTGRAGNGRDRATPVLLRLVLPVRSEDQPGDSLVAKLRGRGPRRRRRRGGGRVRCRAASRASRSRRRLSSAPLLSPRSTTNRPSPARPPARRAWPGFPQELNDHPRYRVVAALGAGGMGAVYRAEHRLMDRPVALKVIRGDLLGSAAMVERFRREVKAAARLASHPNIVAAYDAEQAGETHMLVMEFVEGTDLAELVKRRGPLPVGEACEYARQAALGLQHAFEDGMVHRDIKPQNLMRTTRGQVKILDFGLARFASEAACPWRGMTAPRAWSWAPPTTSPPSRSTTRTPPTSGPIIYSLGCTLYFLLAGRPPFPDGSLIQKLMAHREKTPRPLAEIRADVPPELARVVERMMAKDPAQRFQTPDEVARALAPFADARAARAAATASTPARRPCQSLAHRSPRRWDRARRAAGNPPRQGRRRPWVRIAAALALAGPGRRIAGPDLHAQTRVDKTIVTVQPEAPKPVPAPTSDLLAGPEPKRSARSPASRARTTCPSRRGRSSFLRRRNSGADRLSSMRGTASPNTHLCCSAESHAVVQELHAFAVGRDGRQYYLCSNEPSLVQADKDGEKTIFTHTTYVRDLALDEDDNIYFSEGSGAGSDGKIYRLVPATDKAAARAELFCTVDPRKVSGYWDGTFAFGRNAKGKVDTNTLYLSSGNCTPGVHLPNNAKSGPVECSDVRVPGRRENHGSCVHLAGDSLLHGRQQGVSADQHRVESRIHSSRRLWSAPRVDRTRRQTCDARGSDACSR